MKAKNISSNQNYILTLTNYAVLLKTAFESDDLEGFSDIFNDYENLERPHVLISEFYEHFRKTIDLPPFGENDKVEFPIPEDSHFELLWMWSSVRFALYSWILHAYSSNIVTLTSERIDKYLLVIERSPTKDYASSVRDNSIVFNLFIYLYLNGYDILDLDRWEWHARKRYELKVYTVFGVHDWMPTGIVLYFIRNISGDKFSVSFWMKSNVYRNLFDIVDKKIAEIKGNYDKYVGIIGNIDEKALDERCRAIISFWKLLWKDYEVELNKYVAKEPLDREMVSSFVTGEVERLYTNSEFRDYFDFFNATTLTSVRDDEFSSIHAQFHMESGKRPFIRNLHMDIYGFSLSWQVARKEDFDFITLLDEYIVPINGVKSHKRIDVIDRALSELREKEITPTIILVPREWLWRYNVFEGNDSYVESPQDDTLRGKLSELVGNYRSIPVATISLPDQRGESKILVADFAKAFTWKQIEQNQDGGDVISIQVKEIDFDRATELLQSKDESFYSRVYGTLTEQEAITELQTGIDILVDEEYKYEVLNKDAFVFYDVTIDYGRYAEE